MGLRKCYRLVVCSGTRVTICHSGFCSLSFVILVVILGHHIFLHIPVPYLVATVVGIKKNSIVSFLWCRKICVQHFLTFACRVAFCSMYRIRIRNQFAHRVQLRIWLRNADPDLDAVFLNQQRGICLCFKQE